MGKDRRPNLIVLVHCYTSVICLWRALSIGKLLHDYVGCLSLNLTQNSRESRL